MHAQRCDIEPPLQPAACHLDVLVWGKHRSGGRPENNRIEKPNDSLPLNPLLYNTFDLQTHVVSPRTLRTLRAQADRA